MSIIIHLMYPYVGYFKRLVLELVETEAMGKEGMNRANMGSIKGFIVYTTRMYQVMNPHLKSLHLGLDIWIHLRHSEVGHMQGENIKLAEMDGK